MMNEPSLSTLFLLSHFQNLNKDELLRCLEYIEKTKNGLIGNGKDDDDGDSTTVSLTFSSSKMKHSPKKQKQKKTGNKSKPGRIGKDGDIFIDVIIDELKRENTELKLQLKSRDDQLKVAAERVKELFDENARLAKKLEKTQSRAQVANLSMLS